MRCEVLTPGQLGSKRHINLPGIHVNLPSLTAKDMDDLRAGVKAGIDFVALSFVRDAEAIRELRCLLDSLGSSARIIPKIEDQAGVRNMDDIIGESDGIMVARGDLGIEIDYHRLPLVQDVSTAVREQADALMLSGETATGAYPLETVQVMKNIIQSIEPSVNGALNTKITNALANDRVIDTLRLRQVE